MRTRTPPFSSATSRQTVTRKPRALVRRTAALVALAGLGFATAVFAQSTSVNGKIAYAACDYNSTVGAVTCDIWAMDANGTGQANLTNSPAVNESGPVWSPDGTRIAFTSDAGPSGLPNVWIMNADGSNAFQVTNDPVWGAGVTWSPGGTQLAYVRQVPGVTMGLQFDIFVINTDGTGPTNITNSDFDEIEPAWSPDGARIAFAGVRPETYLDPVTGAPVAGAQWEIVTVDPDGSGEQILSAGDRGSLRAQYLEEDRGPAWSPDGSKLVFMSQDQIPSCCGPWQIWAVNRDGSGISNLTNDATVNDLFPSWSPDGATILFSGTRDSTVGQFDLYTMPAPTTLPVGTAPLAKTAIAAAAPTGSVTRLTTGANASEPNWGRNPNAPSNLQSFGLYVAVSATGRGAGGTVASQPAGIKCGRDCSQPYASGTQVTLTAKPKKGSAFGGWTGACRGATTTCTVTMNDVKVVGASFAR